MNRAAAAVVKPGDTLVVIGDWRFSATQNSAQQSLEGALPGVKVVTIWADVDTTIVYHP